MASTLNNTFSPGGKIGIGLLAMAVAWAGFDLGFHGAKRPRTHSLTETARTSVTIAKGEGAIDKADFGKATIRNVAQVPFSELYEILRTASAEQLRDWAAELARMPSGPQRSAAITTFYKGLIQVNPDAAINAVLQIRDTLVRDLAIGGAMRAAPESVLGKIAEMLVQVPHPEGRAFERTFLWEWSSVDPPVVAKFLQQHASEVKKNSFFYDVLYNWGGTDPKAAVAWLSENPSRRDQETIRGLLGGWEETDRAGAIDYAVANAANPDFNDGRNELAYTLLRKNSPDEARAMILRLPPEQATATVNSIAEETTGILGCGPDDYQRPVDEMAKWIVTLPVNLWEKSIDRIFDGWNRDDPSASMAWLDQLSPATRDVVAAEFCRDAVGDRNPPESIIKLGMSVSDAKLRDQALGEFVRGLGETREEAMHKLNTLSVSREEKAYLRRIMAESPHAHDDER